MLKTQALVADDKLESSDQRDVLLKLASGPWKPALLESQRTFLQLAGVESLMASQVRQPEAVGRRLPPEIFGGDLFFKERDLYYFVTNPLGVSFEREFLVRGERTFWRRGEEETKPTIEVGVISTEAEGIVSRLQGFAAAVEEATKSSLDGRKTRYMSFKWREVEPRTARIARIVEVETDQSPPRFARATLEMTEVQGAEVLASKPTRDALIELSQAEFVREKDVFSRKAKELDSYKKALGQLLTCSLARTEYLLECRRTGAPLTRVKTKEHFDTTHVKELVCHHCGARFGDELLTEGFSPTDLGKKMIRQSYWMTVWVTDLLHRMDLNLDSIVWNVSESGEEVDLFAEFLGRLWIFELKDKEFGPGDAHPLNYRQVRYRADRTFIITTERVSKDAKRVFEELARSSRKETGPLYIEGLEHADPAFKTEIEAAAIQYAHDRLLLL